MLGREAREVTPPRREDAPPCSWHSNFRIAAGQRRVNSLNDQVDGTLYPRPARGRQNDDRYAPRRKVLLIPKIRVGRDQQIEAVSLGGIEQTAIGELSSATLVCRGYLVLHQEPAQWRWRTLIEEDAHLRWCQRAPRRMLQHRANLLDGDPRKPFDELRHLRAVFEIFE